MKRGIEVKEYIKMSSEAKDSALDEGIENKIHIDLESIYEMMGGHGLDLDGSGTGLGQTVKDHEEGQSSFADLFSREIFILF
ncbi:MAG: hypothetical protein AAFR83_23905, partial [Cyanobacteria bacterium J06629_18]